MKKLKELSKILFKILKASSNFKLQENLQEKHLLVSWQYCVLISLAHNLAEAAQHFNCGVHGLMWPPGYGLGLLYSGGNQNDLQNYTNIF